VPRISRRIAVERIEKEGGLKALSKVLVEKIRLIKRRTRISTAPVGSVVASTKWRSE
jgi:hypothetical protein